jgi:hypothetical protein
MKPPFFFALAIAMFLTACAPVVSSRYEPHGTGKVFGPGACSVNDWASMEITLGAGTSLFIGARMPSKGNLHSMVEGSLSLQPLQQARIESTVLKVKTASTTEYVSVPITELTVVYKGSSPDGSKPYITKMDANQRMDGGPVGAGKIKRETDYIFEVPLPFQGSPEFTVILPSILVGTRSVTIDPVTFTVLTHPRLVGFAC